MLVIDIYCHLDDVLVGSDTSRFIQQFIQQEMLDNSKIHTL